MVAPHRLPIEKGARERGGRRANSLSYCNLTIRPSVSFSKRQRDKPVSDPVAFPFRFPLRVLEAELQRELDLPRRPDRA